MKDITTIILILVAICGVVGYYILPHIKAYIKAKTEALKANMSASDWAELCKWVSIGVKAAEQLFPESGQGVSKKQFVLNWLKNHVLGWLEQRNITFDVDSLDNLLDTILESEVFKLNLSSRYVGGYGEIMEGVALLEDPVEDEAVPDDVQQPEVPAEEIPSEESPYYDPDDDPVPHDEPQDTGYKVPFTVPQDIPQTE